ncbi:ador-1 [Pristionchus pacificus]|uniref:Ador-1 n=1 Tax=Pristionchus pacificus TaxID=54126 RepID=A0A2A6B5W0_PRIPA|nr:ador-1 [Pristionchus pacificus]|eukprot:PDM61243.1 ador-1 [Pristionchus pacificus]
MQVTSFSLLRHNYSEFTLRLKGGKVLTQQPRDFSSCLFVHLILCILCTISTFHMLAIALDKYITICRANAFMKSRRSRAVLLIGIAWIAGSLIGALPMFDAFGFKTSRISNYIQKGSVCQFTHIMDYRFLVYVIFFATILAPSAVIIFCYIAIHQRIRTEEMQVKCFLGQNERERRMNGRRKLIRILLILVSTYAICWYPLYIMNTMAFYLPVNLHPSPGMQLCAVVLSHLSCAINPVIYAYGMPGFKKVLRPLHPRFLATSVLASLSHFQHASLRVHHTLKDIILPSPHSHQDTTSGCGPTPVHRSSAQRSRTASYGAAPETETVATRHFGNTLRAPSFHGELNERVRAPLLHSKSVDIQDVNCGF